MRSTHFEEQDHHAEMPVRFKLEKAMQLDTRRGKNEAKPKAKAASATR